MNKNSSFIIVLALVFAFVIIFWSGSGPSTGSNSNGNANVASGNNVEIKDGIQYVHIDAGGGYLPRLSIAKAGIPTKLVMKTNGAFDCSSSLVIRAINYQQILPPTGETEIDLGTPSVGQQPIQGVCGMGMYSFQVRFN